MDGLEEPAPQKYVSFADVLVLLEVAYSRGITEATNDLRSENQALRAQLSGVLAADGSRATERSSASTPSALRQAGHAGLLQVRATGPQISSPRQIVPSCQHHDNGVPEQDTLADALPLLEESHPQESDASAIAVSSTKSQRSAQEDFEPHEEWVTGVPDDLTSVADVLPQLVIKGVRPSSSPDAEADYWHEIRTSCLSTPTSKFRLCWQVSGALQLLWDMVFIPMAVFDIPLSTFQLALNVMSVIYWTFDIPLSFVVGYFKPDGTLEMQLSHIARAYLKTWFPVDLAVVLVDWALTLAQIGMISSLRFLRVGKLARIMRLLRIVRLFRLTKLRSLAVMIQDYTDSQYTAVILNLLKMLVCIFILNHWIACIWYLLGSTDFPGYTSWTHFPDYELQSHAWQYSYLTALHWSIAQFTPGPMRVQPHNPVERLFNVIVLLFALLVFSSFVSTTTGGMMKLINAGAEESRQNWILRKYLRQNKISRELTIRITRFVEHVLHRRHISLQQDEVCYLTWMSPQLKGELTSAIYNLVLDHHCFFKNFRQIGKPVVDMLSQTAMRKITLSREDSLFNSGQKVQEMYFVISGQLRYDSLASGIPEATVAPNTWCTEVVLWTKWTVRGNMSSMWESELLALDSNKFREVVTVGLYIALPMAYAARYAQEYVKMLNQSGEEVSNLDIGFQKQEIREIVENVYRLHFSEEVQRQSSFGEHKVMSSSSSASKRNLLAKSFFAGGDNTTGDGFTSKLKLQFKTRHGASMNLGEFESKPSGNSGN